jgi:hypothetical protein
VQYMLIALLLLPIKCKLLSELCVCHVYMRYDGNQNFEVEISALNRTVMEASSWCCFVCAHSSSC